MLLRRFLRNFNTKKTYNYRLFDRYARPVVSLAVLGEGQRETSGQFR